MQKIEGLILALYFVILLYFVELFKLIAQQF